MKYHVLSIALLGSNIYSDFLVHHPKPMHSCYDKEANLHVTVFGLIFHIDTKYTEFDYHFSNEKI